MCHLFESHTQYMNTIGEPEAKLDVVIDDFNKGEAKIAELHRIIESRSLAIDQGQEKIAELEKTNSNLQALMELATTRYREQKRLVKKLRGKE